MVANDVSVYSIVPTASVSEGGELEFLLTRTGDTSEYVQVRYTLDRGDSFGTVEFDRNETNAILRIQTYNDNIVYDQDFRVELVSAPNGTIDPDRSVSYGSAIEDDIPVYSISNPSPVTEGGDIQFTITRTGDTTQYTSVTYEVNGERSTVYFAPGWSEETVNVGTTEDSLVSDQTKVFTLISADDGTIDSTRSVATGLVIEDDVPVYSIVSATTVNEGGSLVFNVTRTGDATQASTVEYRLNGETAIVEFAANATTATITSYTIDDLVVEQQTAAVILVEASDGTISLTAATATGVAIEDDVPVYSIANAPTVSEGSDLVFTVTRTGDATSAANVTYFLNGELSVIEFVAGSTTAVITVGTVDDTVLLSQSATIQLIEASNGAIDPAAALATAVVIENDVVAPPTGGGGSPSPSLIPSAGPDFLLGSSAPDTIDGGLGDDNVAGGLGNDFLNGNQGDDAVNGNQGDDLVHGGQGNDIVNGGRDNDQVYGDMGNDIVSGDMGNDFVNGNQGNDFVNGNQGDDTVHGGQGDDEVHGGQGNDFVFGDLGNDVIWGDLGNDILTGGAGSDTFVFGLASGNDIIVDFNTAEADRLNLQGQTYTIADSNGSAILTLSGGGTITLTGVSAASIDETDFV